MTPPLFSVFRVPPLTVDARLTVPPFAVMLAPVLVTALLDLQGAAIGRLQQPRALDTAPPPFRVSVPPLTLALTVPPL